MKNIGVYKNAYGEEIKVNLSSYDILTTDNSGYDLSNIRIINPFDLNITKDNPYKNEEKNKSCFLEIETETEKILLIFKTNEIPSFAEMYELYYNYKTDSYDVSYNHCLINKNNQLVVMYGNSIIILNINTLDVIKYGTSDKINCYGINIFEIDNYYIVEDIKHKFTIFDCDLSIIDNHSDELKKIIDKLKDKSKNKY